MIEGFKAAALIFIAILSALGAAALILWAMFALTSTLGRINDWLK